MRIAIYGSGGVGGYFGGRLVQSGQEVIFLARGKHLQALRAGGLRVESIKGDFVIHPVTAVDDPRQVGPVDIVLVCVKAWQVPDVALSMPPMMGNQTGVVYLGNGVDAAAQLAAVLGNEHVMGGRSQISSMIAAPGLIRHIGIEPRVAIGEFDGQIRPRTTALRQAFEQAGVFASIPEDIQASIWEKFVFIAAISGVGAVTRVPVGIMRNIPETRLMLEAVVAEIEQVGRAKQVQLAQDIAARTMAFIDSIAPNVTASMQRDIMEGRPSELGSQNGAVVRMGLELGLATPVNELIYASLLPQELAARGEIAA